MEQTFETIQTLNESIAQEIAERSAQKKNLLNHLTIKALESASSRLNRIEHLLRIDAYDLVFIGEVGAGKTTAICHLFNLTYEAEVTRIIKGAKSRTRKVKVIKDVFPTGSGRTTLCEFIIQPDEKSFLEIEPYSEAKFREIIRDFCEYIWYKAEKESGSRDTTGLSSELDRAVRNIVGLKLTTKAQSSSETDEEIDEVGIVLSQEDETETENTDGSKKQSSNKTIDDAIEFAKNFEESQKQEFINAVWDRANMLDRTQTSIEPTESFTNSQHEKVWLAKMCTQLNTASLPQVPLPRKVTVHISPQILSLKDYPHLRSVIDTKGLEPQQSRTDLASYIRQLDQSLCIFTDRFPHAPGGILSIMETYLTPESQDIHTRSLMFIMPQGEEPEKLHTPSGEPANDWDDGCAYRRSDIESVLTNRVNFDSKNSVSLIFYDAKRYYSDDNLNIGKYVDMNSMPDPSEIVEAKQQLQQDIEEDRQRVFAEIEQVIKRRKDNLWDEVEQLQADFHKIKTTGGLSKEDQVPILMAKGEISNLSTCEFSVAANFASDYFLAWLEGLHPMTLRAVNNRFGEYEDREINIFAKAGEQATTLAETTLRPDKDKILGHFRNIQKYTSVGIDIEPIINQFVRDIDSSFNQLVNKIGNEVKDYLKQELEPLTLDNSFWCDVQSRFGRGIGFREAVIGMYADKVEDVVNSFLKKTTEELWEKEFIKTILDFFGNEEY
jgi:hypothetical protein